MEILLSIYTELQPILTGTAMRLLHMCISPIDSRFGITHLSTDFSHTGTNYKPSIAYLFMYRYESQINQTQEISV